MITCTSCVKPVSEQQAMLLTVSSRTKEPVMFEVCPECWTAMQSKFLAPQLGPEGCRLLNMVVDLLTHPDPAARATVRTILHGALPLLRQARKRTRTKPR